MLRLLDREVRAVTFDCWGTLLRYEPAQGRSHELRVRALQRALRAAGVNVGLAGAAKTLRAAHQKHNDAWQAAESTGSPEIARWALEACGVKDAEIERALVGELQEAALQSEVAALDGAVETLRTLGQRDIRMALVCDTGFTPGRVVRQLLARVDLLAWLEVQIFSDEAGLTKPHAPVFRAALDGLGADPAHTVHVGDLRRTDVQGARELGMGTIRIRDFNDDDSDLPDADAVADHHPHLLEILGAA